MKFLFLTGFEVLNHWIPAIVNHLYWSIATCNENVEELVERFLSVIHHVCNRHKFPGNKYYFKCEHEPYTNEEAKEREWVKMGSPPHELLKKIVLQPQLVKDMRQMNKNI